MCSCIELSLFIDTFIIIIIIIDCFLCYISYVVFIYTLFYSSSLPIFALFLISPTPPPLHLHSLTPSQPQYNGAECMSHVAPFYSLSLPLFALILISPTPLPPHLIPLRPQCNGTECMPHIEINTLQPYI